MTIFKILSLDGGGIKGLYTLYMLLEFENRYCNGESIADYFDMISGTSVGGIITLALANKIPLKDIISFFESNATVIFPQKRPIYRFIRQLLGYKYENTELKKALTKFFGDKQLKHSNNVVCIPSFNASTCQPIIFKYMGKDKLSYRDENISLVDICLATSAAPTFFPMYHINNDHISGWFMDGGIWANDALISITEAMNKFVGKNKQFENYSILSIGNMFPVTEVSKFSVYYWNITRVSKLIESMFYGFTFATMRFVKLITELTGSKFVRIVHNDIANEQVESLALDSCDQNSLLKLKEYALEDSNVIISGETDIRLDDFFVNKKTIVL